MALEQSRKAHDFLLNAVDSLESRIRTTSNQKLLSISQDYQNLLLSHSPTQMAEATGFSEAAFIAVDKCSFKPASRFPTLIRVGSMTHDAFEDSAPLLLDLSKQPHLAVGGKSANQIVDNLVMRYIAALEPDLLRVTFIDPLWLGSQFASFCELNDAIKTGAVLTESGDIERALTEAKAWAVEVIQHCLKAQFMDLDAFNSQQVATCRRPHHVIVYKNFPTGINRSCLELFQALLNPTVTRAGIHLFLTTTDDLDAYEDLMEASTLQMLEFPKWIDAWKCEPDLAIPESSHKSIIYAANSWLKQRPAVTWSDVTVEMTGITHSNLGITIPFGITANGQLAQLQLGSQLGGQHVLIGGTTGSGKSILIHNIIINAAERYSPDELSFYLIDFKEGTELACYKDLPHVRVMAIDADRRFGIELLEHLQAELVSRGATFKSAGVASLQEHFNVTGHVLPRIVVVLDEFQVLLTNDALGMKSAALLDDLTRRGRSFGIHIILASQSLVEVNLKGSMLSNIGIRIGLKMPENDAMRFFSRDNIAASKLNNVGAAVLNNTHGQGLNTHLQVPLISREERLHRVAILSKNYTFFPSRFIKDDTGTAANFNYGKIAFEKRIIVGNGNYIASCNRPEGFEFKAALAQNLLIVGQKEDDVIAFSKLIAYQLLTKYKSHVVCLDHYAGGPDSKFLSLQRPFPQHFRVFLPEMMFQLLDEIHSELQVRQFDNSGTTEPEILTVMITKAAASAILTSRETISGSPASKLLEKILKTGSLYRIYVVLTVSHSGELDNIFSNSREVLTTFGHKIIYASPDAKLLPEIVLKANEGILISGEERLPIRLFESEKMMNFVNAQISYEVVYVDL